MSRHTGHRRAKRIRRLVYEVVYGPPEYHEAVYRALEAYAERTKPLTIREVTRAKALAKRRAVKRGTHVEPVAPAPVEPVVEVADA